MSDAPPPARPAGVRAHLRRRHERYWAPLVYVAALLVVYRAIVFPAGPPVGFGWDTIEAYWADLGHFAGRLRAGDWPLWDAFEKLGYPDFAMPERGHYYPLNWLLAGGGAALAEAPWWLIQLKVLLHHLVAGLAMHVYLRGRRLPTVAALVGGLGWMASAPLLVHKASSVIWPLVWAPLVWLAIDRLVARRDWRAAVLLGGALGLAGDAGSAPGFFYVLLLAAPYAALRVSGALLAARRGPGDADAAVAGAAGHPAGAVAVARALLVPLAIAAAVTAALVAVWAIPAAELTALSGRAERSLAYATSFPLPPAATLVGLVAPLRGVADAYVGVGVLGLALVAVTVAPRADGGVPLLAAAAAAGFLVLAFGAATPILPALVEAVPGFDLFRAANRFKLCAAPLLCVAAAHGAGALLDRARATPARRRAAIAAIAAVPLAVALLAWGAPVSGAAPAAPGGPSTASMLAVAVAAALAMLAVLALRGRAAAAAAAALAALAVVDAPRYAFARGLALEARPAADDDRRWLAALAADGGGGATDGQLWDEFVLEQRPGPRLGVRELRGYPAGSSLEYQPYADLVAAVRRAPELLAAYNVRHVLWGRHHRIGLGAHVLTRPPSDAAPAAFERVRDHLHRVRRPTPAVAWYGAVRVVDGPPAAVLAAVRATLPPDGPRAIAVVGRDGARALGAAGAALEAAAAAAPPPSVAGRVLAQRAARLDVEIDAPAAGLVVVAHTAYPGWRVAVDGVRTAPIVVDHVVRGVAVAAGRHHVRWELRPRGHGVRLAAWWLAFVAVLCAALPPRPRKPGHEAPTSG